MTEVMMREAWWIYVILAICVGLLVKIIWDHR